MNRLDRLVFMARALFTFAEILLFSIFLLFCTYSTVQYSTVILSDQTANPNTGHGNIAEENCILCDRPISNYSHCQVQYSHTL